MNKLLLAFAAACFAVMLAMPLHAEAKARTGDVNAGDRAEQSTDLSSRRHWRGRHWGYRRAYWGPRRYWGPRYRYWGPRRAYWGPRRVWWGPRYYWRPRPVFWGPRYYWGGPVITVGFGPRWWW